MGNWRLTISGVGPHHNARERVAGEKEFDVDRLALELVKELRERGHSIAEAKLEIEPTSTSPRGFNMLRDGAGIPAIPPATPVAGHPVFTDRNYVPADDVEASAIALEAFRRHVGAAIRVRAHAMAADRNETLAVSHLEDAAELVFRGMQRELAKPDP